MIRFRSKAHGAVLCCLAMLITVACNRNESGAGEQAAKQTAAVSAMMQAQLAMADAVDGNKDGVVGRCAGCLLGMDGSADHALQVGEFQMHFCSDGCRTAFAEDVEKSVLAMTIPEH